MPAVIKVTARPSFKDLAGQKFEKANRKLLENKREMMRYLGRRYVEFARDEAPVKTGKFAKGIRWRSFHSGDNVGFTVSTPQPLGRFIIEGTKPHIITPKGSGYPLRFYWEKMGRVVHFYSVNHPGTKPNPFTKRATERWLPVSRRELNRISVNWGVDFAS